MLSSIITLNVVILAYAIYEYVMYERTRVEVLQWIEDGTIDLPQSSTPTQKIRRVLRVVAILTPLLTLLYLW